MAKQTIVSNKVGHVVADVAEILALQVTVAGKKQLDTYANQIVYLTGKLSDILACQGVPGTYSVHARPDALYDPWRHNNIAGSHSASLQTNNVVGTVYNAQHSRSV